MTESNEVASANKGPVVAVLGGSEGEEVLRLATSLAKGLEIPLDCLTIDAGLISTPDEGRLLEESQRGAARAGARLVSRANVDAAKGILGYALERKAQAIVMGSGRRGFGRRGTLGRLFAAGSGIPVLAVGAPRRGSGPRSDTGRPDNSRLPPTGYKLAQYLIALAVIAALTVVNLVLANYAGYWAASIPYLAAISLLALVLDRLPVLFAGLLSAAAWDFLFIPPRYTFTISRTEDVLMLALYLFVAVCSGWLTGRLSASERLLVVRERRMSRLSELASALSGAEDLNGIVAASVEALRAAFDSEATIILRAGAGSLRPQAETGWEPLDENARAAARLCLDSGESAGRFTDEFEASEWHFAPMESPRGRLGVIGLRPASDRYWNQDVEAFLRTMARTVSIALARVFPAQE